MAVQAAKQTLPAKSISRREFLFYLGGASLALSGVGACSIATWFAAPRHIYGPKSGVYWVDLRTLPSIANPVIGFEVARCFLVYTETGLLALDPNCPHNQDSLLRWEHDRFSCPNCGSRFTLDGRYETGPAPRNMDRFRLEVRKPGAILRTSELGEPVNIDGATEILLYRRHEIQGQAV